MLKERREGGQVKQDVWGLVDVEEGAHGEDADTSNPVGFRLLVLLLLLLLLLCRLVLLHLSLLLLGVDLLLEPAAYQVEERQKGGKVGTDFGLPRLALVRG